MRFFIKKNSKTLKNHLKCVYSSGVEGELVLHTWVLHFTLRRRDYTQMSEIVRGITHRQINTHGLIDYITDYTSLQTRSPTFLDQSLIWAHSEN